MIINTHELAVDGTYGGKRLDESTNLQVYCGLDSMVTLEVREQLGTLFNQIPPIYDFERALQGPYLEIMQRGFLTDDLSRRHAARELRLRIDHINQVMNELALAVWGRGLNANSPSQLKDFFFGALRLPEVWQSKKGVRRLSTDREALEKLYEYLYARPFVNCILAIRDLTKQLNLFEVEIDTDNRFRAGYNIAGTETGRPSSSTNAFGTASNAQNIAPGLRYIFVADPGKRMCVIDLEQVEARDVGFFAGCLFDDWSFLDSCESGDLHTNNAKRIWPELGWTGDPKRDRAIADKNFYREFSYRDMAKRGSHLSNYMGTAWTAARSLKVPLEIMEEFQARYCKGRSADYRKKLPAVEAAFPCIPRWWQWTAQQLQTNHKLITPFGRQRHFFGRPGDDTTIREAIAFLPQSTTADRMNLGLWRIWRYMPQVELLAQTYDSVTFQYNEGLDENTLVAEALQHIRVELLGPNGRSYVVPGEAKVGWNWGARVTAEDQAKARAVGRKVPRLNEDGLVKWSPSFREARQRKIGIKRKML